MILLEMHVEQNMHFMLEPKIIRIIHFSIRTSKFRVEADSFVQCSLYSAPHGSMPFILTCVMCSKGGHDSVSLLFCLWSPYVS